MSNVKEQIREIDLWITTDVDLKSVFSNYKDTPHNDRWFDLADAFAKTMQPGVNGFEDPKLDPVIHTEIMEAIDNVSRDENGEWIHA